MLLLKFSHMLLLLPKPPFFILRHLNWNLLQREEERWRNFHLGNTNLPPIYFFEREATSPKLARSESAIKIYFFKARLISDWVREIIGPLRRESVWLTGSANMYLIGACVFFVCVVL